jgi:hypothetical protein
MTKRKAAKLARQYVDSECMACASCGECPLFKNCIMHFARASDLAEAWLRDHPSLWDRIKNTIRGKK